MKAFGRWCGLLVCAAVCLQVFFVLRLASMAVLAPESTSFERSQVWQVLMRQGRLPWRPAWVDQDRIAPSLKRATDLASSIRASASWRISLASRPEARKPSPLMNTWCAS